MARFLQEWRSVPQLTPLLLVMLAIPVVFFGTTLDMAQVWIVNETFTHGFLIFPIAVWLIWQQREAIASIEMHGDLRALLLVLPALTLWVLSTLIGVAAVQQLAMVALIPLSVWLLLGLPLALALLFPLLYLFFAVPIGQALIPPMMEFTADFTVTMIQLTGIPIFRDGLTFQLPSGNWSVVEECSGVRYLIASAALGTIYAYITYTSLAKRTVFIVTALIVPIFANGLRAYGIVMIGHLSGMKYAVGVDHLLYGWVFFGIVIFIMFWIGSFWADPPAAADTFDSPATTVSTPALISFLIVLSLMLVLSLATTILAQRDSGLPAGVQLELPTQAEAWRSTATTAGVTSWQPVFTNPDLRVRQIYFDGGTPVVLDIGYFHRQRDGREAISTLNRLSDPYEGDWTLSAQRRFTTHDGTVTVTVTESELGLVEKVLVWSGYLMGEDFVASPYRAKIMQVQRLMQGREQAAYITLSTRYDDELPALRERLSRAWTALRKPLTGRVTALAESY